MTAYNKYTDQELLALLSEDNQQAFDMIYSRYWEDMYKTAYMILKDTDACKDIVQDIFIWLWEHRHSLEVVNLKSYLRVAVKFKVANYIRSGNIRDSFFAELAKRSAFSTSVSPADITELNQFKIILQKAVSALPDKCREIYKLSREQNLSNNEIAEKLHISVKTVENQKTIAIRRAKEAVQPYLTAISSFFFLSLSLISQFS